MNDEDEISATIFFAIQNAWQSPASGNEEDGTKMALMCLASHVDY